jgi:hypothetical protein
MSSSGAKSHRRGSSKGRRRLGEARSQGDSHFGVTKSAGPKRAGVNKGERSYTLVPRIVAPQLSKPRNINNLAFSTIACKLVLEMLTIQVQKRIPVSAPRPFSQLRKEKAK